MESCTKYAFVMKKNLCLLLILFISTLTSFAQEKEFILEGMIGGINEEMLFLYKNTGENFELIDSVKTQNGEFTFTGQTIQPFAAELRLLKSKRARFFISPAKMDLYVHVDDIKFGFLTGKLTGSTAQDRYEDFQQKLAENNQQKLKIANDLEIPEVSSDEIKKEALLNEYKRLNSFKQDYFYKYASSPVIAYLIYQDYFASQCNVNDLKEYLKTLQIANPNGMYVANLKKRVSLLDALNGNGLFPEINEKTLQGDNFSLKHERGKYVLLYIWRAWTPENNQIHYQALKEIRDSVKTRDFILVNLVRNSSFNMIRIPGTEMGELWKPTVRPELNCIEIESLDNSVEIIRYLDRQFHAYLLDKDGKIIYHQNKFDTSLLISELSKLISKY